MRIRNSISITENKSSGSYGNRDYTNEYSYGYIYKDNCIQTSRITGRVIGDFSGGGMHDTMDTNNYFIWVKNGKGYFTRTHEYNVTYTGFSGKGIEMDWVMMGMVRNGLRGFYPMEIPVKYAQRCINIMKHCLELEVETEANNYFSERINMLMGVKFNLVHIDKRHKVKSHQQRYDKDSMFFNARQEEDYYEQKRIDRIGIKNNKPSRPEKSRNIFSSRIHQ